MLSNKEKVPRKKDLETKKSRKRMYEAAIGTGSIEKIIDLVDREELSKRKRIKPLKIKLTITLWR